MVVGGVGVMLRSPGAAWLPWLAAGVVAVTFAPLRDALQRGANKLTYGQWSQPAEVLAATGAPAGGRRRRPRRCCAPSSTTSARRSTCRYVEITDPDGATLARARRARPATSTACP